MRFEYHVVVPITDLPQIISIFGYLQTYFGLASDRKIIGTTTWSPLWVLVPFRQPVACSCRVARHHAFWSSWTNELRLVTLLALRKCKKVVKLATYFITKCRSNRKKTISSPVLPCLCCWSCASNVVLLHHIITDVELLALGSNMLRVVVKRVRHFLSAIILSFCSFPLE